MAMANIILLWFDTYMYHPPGIDENLHRLSLYSPIKMPHDI